jgi:type 2 lantibiotic biosynthesis protein LanM
VRERFLTISEKQLAQQIALVQTALHEIPGGAPRGPLIAAGDWPAATGELAAAAAAVAGTEPGEDVPAIAQLRAGARRIADELAARAIYGDDGTATWLGISIIGSSESRRYVHTPLSEFLGSGLCGVALFLAAQVQQSPDEDAAGLVALRQAASLQLRHMLRGAAQLPWNSDEDAKLGGLNGIGSLLYALVRTAQLGGDDELLEDALAVLHQVTPERIAADRALDVAAGAAGAILGLLALYDATGDSQALAHAVRCGDHLLARQVEGNSHRRAWPFWSGSSYGTPLTGFAHGAAGIAYALLRLETRAAADRFGSAALDGLAYERALLSTQVGNWPDLRPRAADRFACSWAHGAPGIGLSRLTMLLNNEADHFQVQREIALSIETTQRHPSDGIDAVEHGNFGRLEFLLKAGLTMKQPALVSSARQTARALLARAERSAGFYLFPGHPSFVYDPSFFRGTAGIGYQLLRLAAPAALPSILLFE